MTYPEAIEYLYASLPVFHLTGGTAYKPGPENTLALMAHLANPHARVPSIHIAGTNGKGSTSHLIAAVLQCAGLKVGLYTSPHLVDFRERIRINGQMIPQEQVAGWVAQHREFLDQLKPSFFETSFGMAMDYFAREQVEVAVIETGLGGRLDATNIITPLLSVITNIGMDHTEFLGNTLQKIAREKAGIIKPGVPCVIGETDAATMNVFLDAAREAGILGEGLETTDCRIWFADQCKFLEHQRLRQAPECELHGLYQQHNQQTAYVALKALRELKIKNYELKITPEAIREGFAHVCQLTGLRGRWEILREQPLTICDTGHNSHGLRYVAQQLRALTNPHIWIVFGMVNDKDTEVVMRLLPEGERYHYIFTTPATKRARSAEEMLRLWGKEGIAIEDSLEALRYAQQHASPEDALFIGGSNYLVGYALSRITY
ncbi:MAG: bifunctional folylpolyglutamate synthase/dihydrofolate synthase [Paludibacteraceae bacterium]|nr:bifunctional folylpolyglutamate synthase/dihydrofolate synthase [Paludibacteraceae bacterium]